MPFTWTINPYRGCEFACKYCYARYTHEFMEMRDGLDFERKIYVKQHAAELLSQELRHVKYGEDIAIGTATDPYQPAERKFEVTRGILEEFARHTDLDIGIVTKSDLILRDIDLLKDVSRNRLFINITVTTLNTDLARILEPRAPRPDLRLDAVNRLTRCRARSRGDLRARTPRHHRRAKRPGSPGKGHSAGQRQIHLRQSAVSEALFGGGLHAVPREGVSLNWRKAIASAIRTTHSCPKPTARASRSSCSACAPSTAFAIVTSATSRNPLARKNPRNLNYFDRLI